MSTIEQPGEVKNKQQIRTETSTNALLEAASDLIVEGGFDALTFAAIGDRAGYSRGLVTARFGSKAALIDALIERIVTTWSHRNVLPFVAQQTGLDGLVTLIDAICRQVATDARGVRVLSSLMFEAVGSDEEMRTRFASFHASMRSEIAGLVRAGQEDGSVRGDVSAEREAELLVAAIRGIGYQWLIDPAAFDPAPALGLLRDATAERLAATDAA